MLLHDYLLPVFRRRRMARFARRIGLGDGDRVVDVGGNTGIWSLLESGCKVTFLNLEEEAFHRTDDPRFDYVVGDATQMDFADGEFDICFSNSVIEHLYTYEAQQRFAEACRRIGDKVWVQTPAKCFPIEPHVIGPFSHWFGRPLRRFLIRWFSIWGWKHRSSPEQIDAFMDEVRLLDLKEVEELFPDCEILKERFLGIFVKSYIAVRR